MIGIIGGSGFYRLPGLTIREQQHPDTPYGKPSDAYQIGSLGQETVIFLPRHGQKHTIPPHKVNYRANIHGMKTLGVKEIIAVSAVGGINPKFKTGSLVLPNQIIDFTKHRESTFFDSSPVTHIDLTSPFCPRIRIYLEEIARAQNLTLHSTGTYLCVEGPRYETAAEIRFFANIGADIVGMTAMPEAALAREAEICYAMISLVTNQAAGISKDNLATEEVAATMAQKQDSIKKLLSEIIGRKSAPRTCTCNQALGKARFHH